MIQEPLKWSLVLKGVTKNWSTRINFDGPSLKKSEPPTDEISVSLFKLPVLSVTFIKSMIKFATLFFLDGQLVKSKAHNL